MDSVTPPYYADGTSKIEFIVRGSGFLGLPSNARGLAAYRNDMPLQYIDSQAEHFPVFEVVSDNELIIGYENEQRHSRLFLGAIIKNDGSEVFWENNTRPLP